MNFFFRPQLYLLLFLLSSCSLFKHKRISTDLNKEIQNVCLDSHGAGRILINNHKYVFKYDSALSLADHKWIMGLYFPVYGEEVFEFEWTDKGELDFKASFEQRIIQEKKGVDPVKLDLFLSKWSELIYDVIQLQYTKNYQSKYEWKLDSKFLSAHTKINDETEVEIIFKNKTSDGHFGRFDIILQSKKHEENFSLEMIVRKCLEKTE